MITKFKLYEGLKFYSSNFDKYMMPQEPGWYISYRINNDTGFMKVDREPIDFDDAKSMLPEYYTPKFWKYVNSEDIKQWDIEEKKSKFNL